MSRDLIFDRNGRRYASLAHTPEQRAAVAAKMAIYLRWVDAKMARQFTGTLAEFKAAIAQDTVST